MAVRFEGPVLVGLEPSRSGLAALDLAADVAASRHAGLTVLHAAGDSERGGEALATAAVERVRSRRPAVAVRAELTGDEPAAALLRRARCAGLVVVGHRGRGAGRTGRSTAGSVAVTVATRAPVPVVVHRPIDGPGPRGRPVAIGIGAVPDDEPLAFAFAEADRLGVPLVVEHVWSGPADNAPASAGVDRRTELAALADASRLVDDTISVWSDKFPHVQVRRALRHGLDPAFALTAASRAARLLVVGATTSGAPLIEALVHRAGCPVAVVNWRVHAGRGGLP
jgi:nucleotide-binding universal stress UspA family protein